MMLLAWIAAVLVCGKICFYVCFRLVVGPQVTLGKTIRLTFEWPTLGSLGIAWAVAAAARSAPWDWLRITIEIADGLGTGALYVYRAMDIFPATVTRAIVGLLLGAVTFGAAYLLVVAPQFAGG
jgi:hypothetical protein